MELIRVIHVSASPAPLSSRAPEGRFHTNLEEARRTAYLSFDLATCLKEVRHHLGDLVPLHGMRAVRFQVAASHVVDLTSASECERYGVTLAQLVNENYEVTHQLARRLRGAGVQALVVPSARDSSGKNVVLFLENIANASISKTGEESLE